MEQDIYLVDLNFDFSFGLHWGEILMLILRLLR
jgi:hypothetical protein